MKTKLKSQIKGQGRILFLILALAGSFACTTTKTVQHNKAEGTLSLFSHTDPASTDGKLKSDDVSEGVIEAIKKDLEKDPKNVEAAITLANIYLALSNSQESIKYAKIALRFDLKEHRARLILAQNYYRLEKFKLAEVVVSALPEKYNNNADILNIKALIAYKRDKRAVSWQIFKQATDQHPKNVALAMNFAVLLLKHRQIDLAKVHLDRVIELVPDHQDAKVHLAIIEGTRGNFEVAEKVISDLTTEENRLNKFNLGMIALAKKDYNTAEIKLKQFMADKSADKDSVSAATSLMERIGKEREAIAEEQLRKQMEEEAAPKGKQDVIAKDSEVEALEEELTH